MLERKKKSNWARFIGGKLQCLRNKKEVRDVRFQNACGTFLVGGVGDWGKRCLCQNVEVERGGNGKLETNRSVSQMDSLAFLLEYSAVDEVIRQ